MRSSKWPTLLSTTPCARRAVAASRTARCMRSRRSASPSRRCKRSRSATSSKGAEVDDVDPRLRRSGRRSRRRHRARRGDLAGLFGYKVGPACRSTASAPPDLDSVNFAAGADHVRPARSRDRRRRREHEPRRHRRVGRRLAGRSDDRHSLLFHAAGRLGRSHRDQIRLLARRRRRLRGRIAKARGAAPGKKAASNIRSCR